MFITTRKSRHFVLCRSDGGRKRIHLFCVSVEDRVSCGTPWLEAGGCVLGFRKLSDVKGRPAEPCTRRLGTPGARPTGVPRWARWHAAVGPWHREVPAYCSALANLLVLTCHGCVVWHTWENQRCLPEHLLGTEFSRLESLLYPQVLISSDCWHRMTLTSEV